MNETLHGILFARWQRRDKADPHVFQFTEYQLRKMMESLCGRASVPPFGFHAIRHHVSSLLNDKRKGIKQIQRLLGHKSQATTETYLHALDDDLRKAVEGLEE